MQAFYAAFKTAVHAGSGKPLLTALAVNEKHSVAWRAINGLNWPGNATETDYPAAVLDRVTEALPKSWKVSAPEDRKTVGNTGTATTAQRNSAIQSAALHHGAHNIVDATRAIDYIVRRMGQHG
jgi:hypothetical protein